MRVLFFYENRFFLPRLIWPVLLVLLLAPLYMKAQGTDASDPSPLKFPVPRGIANQLFYLQRDPNTNTIIYELNVGKSGDPDEQQPVLAYWIRYGEDGKKQELSYIQRKFAYGIQSRQLGKDHYELRFVSHKKLPLYLQRSGPDKKFHIYATVNDKRVQIERIFVRIVGGSFWLPNVRYVEITGFNAETNDPVTERIKV